MSEFSQENHTQSKEHGGDQPHSNHRLIRAIINHDLAACKQYIEEGDDVNQRVAEHWDVIPFKFFRCRQSTPIHFVRRLSIAQLLIDSKADVNMADENNKTPLFFAHTSKIAQLLIDHNADVNAKNVFNLVPLSQARNVEIAKVLIKYKADVNAANSFGYSLLHQYQENQFNIMKLVLESKANPNVAENKEKETPLHMTNSAKIIQLLVEHSADIEARNVNGCTPLLTVRSNALRRALMRHGANLNSADHAGCTLLHRVGDPDLTRLLLESHADPTICHNNGQTPLQFNKSIDVKNIIREYVDVVQPEKQQRFALNQKAHDDDDMNPHQEAQDNDQKDDDDNTIVLLCPESN